MKQTISPKRWFQFSGALLVGVLCISSVFALRDAPFTPAKHWSRTVFRNSQLFRTIEFFRRCGRGRSASAWNDYRSRSGTLRYSADGRFQDITERHGLFGYAGTLSDINSAGMPIGPESSLQYKNGEAFAERKNCNGTTRTSGSGLVSRILWTHYTLKRRRTPPMRD